MSAAVSAEGEWVTMPMCTMVRAIKTDAAEDEENHHRHEEREEERLAVAQEHFQRGDGQGVSAVHGCVIPEAGGR